MSAQQTDQAADCETHVPGCLVLTLHFFPFAPLSFNPTEGHLKTLGLDRVPVNPYTSGYVLQHTGHPEVHIIVLGRQPAVVEMTVVIILRITKVVVHAFNLNTEEAEATGSL